MTKVMLLGDIHGDLEFVDKYVISAAKEADVEWIYQVGDFGYWEHMPAGREFLDELTRVLTQSGLKLVFIAGNHDKISYLEKNYQLVDGFRPVRTNIWFAPNGTQWEFESKSFVALGGAYSIDKRQRLEDEAALAETKFNAFKRTRTDMPEGYLRAQAKSETEGLYWFPEEQMSDGEVMNYVAALQDVKIDVILAHDKPFASNPGIELLPINECIPNQYRLQYAVRSLKPKLFVHGHLHVRYTDEIRCGDDGMFTRVEGLGANVPNFSQQASFHPSDAWEILTL
jgi:predicted phosphodiesterase